MIIGVDIDGVLADFNTGFINRVIQVTGRDLFPSRPFDIPTWNYPEHYNYSTAEVSAVWENIKADEGFWASLPPYGDTRSALLTLDALQDDGDEIYFVTARPGVDAKWQTEYWLRCHGFYQPTVLISSAKGLCARALKMDAYLDDRWENVVDVADNTVDTHVGMLVRPWNRDKNIAYYTNLVEVPSVQEFIEQVVPPS